MFTNSKLPLMLLPIAIMAITWFLLSDNKPQTNQSNLALEQLLLDRLAEFDSRLDRLEQSPDRGTVTDPKIISPADKSELESLTERIAALEQRGPAEAASTRSNVEYRSVEERLLARQSRAAMNEPPAAATHFEESDNLDAREQVTLEDVETIFESDDLPNTTLSSVNCREGYCRMEYKVNEAIDPATKEIEENELILKIGEKYGSGTKVHMGRPPADGSTQIYIELPKQ